MQLTKNFTLAEVWKSSDTPSPNQIRTCTLLAVQILQPLRDYIKLPITITSGKRSVVVAGGSTTSEHFYNGDEGAVDINIGNPSPAVNLQAYNWLATNCRYSIGQLIWYTETTHLHISLATQKRIGQLLVCTSKSAHQYSPVSRASEIAKYDKRPTA